MKFLGLSFMHAERSFLWDMHPGVEHLSYSGNLGIVSVNTTKVFRKFGLVYTPISNV